MSSARVLRLTITTLLTASTMLLAYGCNQSEAASKRDKGTASQAEGASKAPSGGAIKAGAKVDESRYLVEIRPSGEYINGKDGVVEIYLETKGDYHVNEDYPHKFAPAGGDGATYKGNVVFDKNNKDTGSLERTKLTLKVPFTPNRTGNVTVAGKFSFGFCTDAQCEMGKLDLELSVAVK